ncbi:T-complex protein 1 subunit delta [Thelohanellus kitauei]|uniref:T-complex protein 1 subunit delta n=1 Tax=Thelohanellus kitauei TaxID=669202 RepID=A0A0C2MH26_THEKT|nr:T-complex protein 1 subunit delta [Thelohanellus kitauei]
MSATSSAKPQSLLLNKKDKPKQIRQSNVDSAKALGDAIRTSLGPRGMDKMIFGRGKNVTITNDGATILKEMKTTHPVAQMLSNMSHSQDIEAGDGTTTVVIYASGFLQAADQLLKREIHPTKISDGFKVATDMAMEILKPMGIPVDLTDRDSLIKNATTSLSSKVVSQNANLLAPLSVDAVLRVLDGDTVDLKSIRVIKRLGGTIEDTELITDGLVLKQKASHKCGNPITRVEKAKIGLIQFCLSPPKTDMENNIIVSDYTQMDRVLRDQRVYILNRCKAIQKTGCNVLLIQKSILRDAVTEQSLQFLNKMKIMVVHDIERDEVEFICKTVGCRPVASVDHFVPEALGTADLVEEISTGFDSYVKISGLGRPIHTVSLVVRGSNELLLEEAERSIHDALCVIRSIVKGRHMIAGGGAAEIELAYQLEEKARLLTGTEALCVQAFARSLEMVPMTLIESSGLNPVQILTDLRRRHASGEKNIGFNVKKSSIRDMVSDNVVQPLLVTVSALRLASEQVRCILKIDDMVSAVR